MKIKNIAAICKKNKYAVIYERYTEAVDMMKHIAAAWNIKPEEVFEKGE